jgi:WD40 repeat protein
VDGTVQLYELPTFKPQDQLKGHNKDVCRVFFSPDSRLLFSASRDGTVRVWDTATKQTAYTLRHDFSGASAMVAGNRHLAAWSYGMNFTLWQLGSKVMTRTLESQINDIAALTFSPDSRLLAFAGTRGLVSIWDIEEAMCPAAADDYRGTIRYVGLADVSRPTFSADGRLLAKSRIDGKPRPWNAETGALRHTRKGQSRPISDVALPADGGYLAYVSEDNTVCVWDTAAGLLKWTLGSSVRGDFPIVFTPDSEHLYLVSLGRTVRSWCLKTGRDVDASAVLIPAAMDRLGRLSPDCKLLAVANDAIVNVVDVKSGAILDTKVLERLISKLAFSPDNLTLAMQLDGGLLTLYNRLSRVHQMARYDALLGELDHSRDSQYLVHRGGAYVLNNHSSFRT